MTDKIFIGIDAGTSQIKCVAYTANGLALHTSTCANEYADLPGGRVEQSAYDTRERLLTTLAKIVSELGQDAQQVVGLAITAMGDGMLLVDAQNKPMHKGWLWLDSRAADIATEIESQPSYDDIFRITGSAINASQMRSHMRWLEQHEPKTLDHAHTAYHWKDYLYQCLTGERATDPSEALFTFGSFITGDYSDEVFRALKLEHRAKLLPPIVDGMHTSHMLLDDIAKQIGLSKAVPVTLGYIDVICSALGGGLYNKGASSALTIMGTTGIHMRYAASPTELQLPTEKTGYTIAFPGGGFVQLQTNMAATLNIDWVLQLGIDAMRAQGHDCSMESMLQSLDENLLKARPGAALYHPYISNAGERGPFFNNHARASFDGLEQSSGYYDLVRSVIEGMCFAARDCYQSIGDIPDEVRLTGGASKSPAVQQILASVLNRPVRVAQIEESGAAGAVMMATVQHGLFYSLSSCTRTWLGNKLGEAVLPNAPDVARYDELYKVYLKSRQRRMNDGIWEQLGAITQKHGSTST